MDKYEVLKKYFGYDSFRYAQESIVDSILNKKNTIAIMQTGGGKSICFQIPALIFEGLSVVISPLISLMYDQVYELKKKDIKAAFLNSTLSHSEKRKILDDILNNNIKILYLSPESLVNVEYLEVLNKVKISLFVIDEAHTIMWHMDFRESFMNIKLFLNNLKYKVPVAAFSATANEYTINEIKKVIGVFDFNIITSSFDRPELNYEIIRNVDKDAYLVDYLNNHIGICGIIYATTKKDVMKLYEKLKDNYSVTYYHGAMDSKLKEENQNKFIKSKCDIIIATVAFGMGINKPDIRFVINYSIPDSIESLAQMSGRCSRDKKYGECIILYNKSDERILDFFIKEIDSSNKTSKEVKRIKSYKFYQKNSIIKICSSNFCIHKYMAYYFGEKINRCITMCSRCKKVAKDDFKKRGDVGGRFYL